MNMKIIHYVEAFGGGVFFAISQIANEQIKLGNEIIILFSRRWDTPNNIEKYFSDKIELIELPFSLTPNILYKHIRTLCSMISNHNPDIIHAHSSYAGFFARIILKNKDCKVYYTPHGLSILRKDLMKIYRYLALLMEKIAHKSSGKVIGCSKSEMNIYKEKISPSRVYYAHNAIPTDKISRFFINSMPELNKFIMVGRIVPQKNPSLFIELKKHLLNKGVKGDFTWVGDGDSLWTKRLVSNGINVTGMLNRKEVWKIMSKSTIFIQTSLWEGMPLTIMEAQCIGLPVVAKDTIGNIDTVIHGSTGMFFNTIDNAVKIIINLLDKNNDNWKKISDFSKDYAMQHYSIKKQCEVLREIYTNY